MLFDLRKKESTAGLSAKDYDDIYFDTCSLLEDGLRSCLRILVPELVRTGKKIVIPYPVVQELSYLVDGITSNCCDRARQARDLVLALAAAGLLEFRGDREISEQADHYFVKAASTDRFRRRIAVVTQDRQLTEDLNLLNRIGSAQANTIHTYKLERGTLVRTQSQQRPKCGAVGNTAEIYRRLGL